MKKVLEISSENSFLNHVNTIAEAVKEKLEVLIDKHPRFFMGIRQKGLMAGLKLKDELCGPLLTKTAFDQGLLLVYANNDKSVCQFLPPLITTEEELDEIIPKLDRAMQEAQKLKPLLKVKNFFGNMFSKG